MSALVGSNLFIMGGWNGFDCLASVEKADLQEENPTFELLPRNKNLIGPVKNGCCVFDEASGKILVIGGWTERDTSDAVLSYDPESNYCDFAGMRLLKPIEGHSVVKVADQIFIFGGFDSFGVTDTIMRIDLTKRHVVMVDARLAQARENHTCQLLHGKYIVVAGGWSGRESLSHPEVFEITPDGKGLKSIKQPSTPSSLLLPRNRPTSMAF